MWQTTASGQAFTLTLQDYGVDVSGGRAVQGAYGADGRRIEAVASGLTLTGRWAGPPTYAEPSNAGRFSFTMAADCGSFAGTWGFASSDSNGGAWTGSRAAANDRAGMVRDAYRAVLCRDPDPSGLAYWSSQPLDRPALEGVLAGTAEGRAIRTVRDAYLAVLGRDPANGDCDAARYWADTGLPRPGIEAQLAYTPEGGRVRAIRDLYLELLGRDPLPDDRLALRGWVDSGYSLDQIRGALMASDEYRRRTG